jgi:hypothetical protein
MSSFADKVREFHEAFGLGVASEPCARPETWKLRIELLREEFDDRPHRRAIWSRSRMRWRTWRT